MKDNPKRGDLAICGAGTLGLITSLEPVPVTYYDGSESLAWTGIHLTDCVVNNNVVKIGNAWSSRNPKVIGHFA